MSLLSKIHPVEIEYIKPIGKGENVCLIFNSDFEKGKAIFSGVCSRALFIIQGNSESKIDAGCVSAYILCKDNKTKYLNEIRRGDEIFMANMNGMDTKRIIKKSKINSCEMLLVKGKYNLSSNEISSLLKREGEDYFDVYSEIIHLRNKKTKNPISAFDINKYKNKIEELSALLDIYSVVKNSDIFLICKDRTPKSIKQLKQGDKILAYIQMPKLQSRHFGMAYEGYCLEK